MPIPMFLILSFTSLRIVFGGSEAVITYQCAKHRNTAARIVPFKFKCTGHMVIKGSIRCHDYDEDVFPMCSELNRAKSLNQGGHCFTAIIRGIISHGRGHHIQA